MRGSGVQVSDVVQRLKRANLPVENRPGVAVVAGGDVTVRQEGGGSYDGAALAIEGVLCSAFYSVRDEVYRQYRLVQE